MKKTLIVLLVLGFAIALTGCLSSKTNTDNADSALIDSETDSSGIISPPVPPEPTR